MARRGNHRLNTELTILRVLDRLGCGGLILSTGGEILAINDNAERVLASQLGLSVEQVSRLPSMGREVLKRLLKQTDKRFRIETDNWAVIPREGRRPLVLDTLLLPPHPSSEAHSALILIDLDQNSDANHTALSRIFGLTSAETRLAALLYLGHSPAQIAEDQDIGISTVRSHLAAIYRKTSASGQQELILMMSRLSILGSSN